MDFNKVILGGRLTANPEIKRLPSGDTVCNFRIAVNRSWKDAKTGAKREDVCFIDVSAFNKRGNVVGEYFTKGSNILIEGRVRHEIWDDKKTGETRSKHSVVADNIAFVDRKPRIPDMSQSESAEGDTGEGDEASAPATLGSAGPASPSLASQTASQAPGALQGGGSVVAKRNRDRALAAVGAVADALGIDGTRTDENIPF